MTAPHYTLLIGDRSYSSWSLRGWLAFRAFGIPVTIEITRFYQPNFAKDLAAFDPSGMVKTVPAVKANDGSLWRDSIAIVEELNARHPEAGLLPTDPALRAQARNLMAEMHASFGTLRNDCPMNTRTSYAQSPVSEALAADLARLEKLWATRRGTWLMGDDYSAVDAFYAPVAARIAGYNLPVSEHSMEYVMAHLTHAPFRQFRAMGFCADPQEFYKRDYPTRDWPVATLSATPTEDSRDCVNDTCPYSGDPVTHYLMMDGKTYGFCNAFCRDKTLHDPEAWPAFMALVR